MSELKCIKMRAHHVICNLCFCGKGYNKEFIANFYDMQKKLCLRDVKVEIVEGFDDICVKCPKNGCDKQKVSKLDENYSQVLNLEIGQVISYKELEDRVSEFLTKSDFESICKECSWYSSNICAPIISDYCKK